ncbi:hypothetical protein ACFXNW_28910 [Nocardia sp. NPDC059180]|uniref:hypothetical protein n=1 Tax=Nocardia sp. NPDC059180 TaxID=3346761 RepID=UPI00367EFF2D
MTETPHPANDPDPDPDDEIHAPFVADLGSASLSPIEEDETPTSGTHAVTMSNVVSVSQHRFTLARGLLALVAATSLFLLAASVFAPVDKLEAVKSMGSIVFGPLVTLLGTSFAWYYATRRSG